MSIAPFSTRPNTANGILILDAQGSSRSMLSALISGYHRRTDLILYAKNASEALDVIEVRQPSVVFLDLDTLQASDKNIVNSINREETDVVFLIEENDPMAQAFDLSNTAYLTKPYAIDNLLQVLDKLSSAQSTKNQETPRPSSSSAAQKITLRSQEGITCLDMSDIRRLESDSNYTHFFLKNGERITISKTLKEYENLLPSGRFFRTHQSHIVNLSLVKKFLKEDGGYALMDDGTHVLVSRRKKSDFLYALTA